MRLNTLIASAIVFALPSLVVAAKYSVTGNKPQPAANYTRWPGLVDVVNQPTRRQLVVQRRSHFRTAATSWL